MYDDATGAHQSPARDDGSILDLTDCPDCGCALADHGIASAGPGRTRLTPCGLDVTGVTLREVAELLSTPDADAGREKCEVATVGGESA
ncbi:hypothetical protein [Halobaculum sp. EA56]|uniref:hypothetical protein n=1 Tax=Halobaculum sp. EA56 TaxID=3421648 RepID=UPI003EB7A9F3